MVETILDLLIDPSPRVIPYAQVSKAFSAGLQLLVKPTVGSPFLASNEKQLKKFARTSDELILGSFVYSIV